jgi:ABC-type Fe3+-siderophore transport system permease subunit
MTVTSLVTAIVLGIVIGGACRISIAAQRHAPMWLPVTASVGAALLGTIVFRIAGHDASGTSALELIVQVASAAMGAAMVAVTADRQSVDRHDSRARPRQ